MTVRIEKIGVAVPALSIAQMDAVAVVAPLSTHDEENRQALQSIYQRSRIRKRHSVVLERQAGERIGQSFYAAPLNGERGPTTEQRMQVYRTHAGRLAVESARSVLDADEARSITHLVTASCSGFSAPGVECELIAGLGLSPSVRRVHIGFMGCHAAINALSVAQAFSAADANARVLVSCVELCSLHLQYGWDRERVMSNALFADGAASALIASGSEGMPLAGTGSLIIPEAADAIRWQVGDHGFEMGLAPELPGIIESRLRGWLEGWLASQGSGLEQVQSWAVHPGGPRILEAVQSSLGLKKADLRHSWDVLGDYGNMSSPTILFILQRLMAEQAALPCVALGFGPGLAIEAALFGESVR